MPAGDETVMGGNVPPAQAGLTDQSDRNTQQRTNAGGRGNIIGGDASAKTSMGGGSGGGGGGSSGGGGGGGGGGYSLGASIAGSQTVASGQSGDQKSGGATGIRSQGGVTFGTIQFAGGDAKNTTGLSGMTIGLLAAGAAVLGIVVWLVMRKGG